MLHKTGGVIMKSRVKVVIEKDVMKKQQHIFIKKLKIINRKLFIMIIMKLSW